MCGRDHGDSGSLNPDEFVNSPLIGFRFQLVLLVLITSTIWVGCSNSDVEVAKVEANQSIPKQIIRGGVFRYSELGKTLHVLQAAELIRQEKGTAETPEDEVEIRGGFNLYIEGDEHDHEAHMQAEWASMDEKNLRLIAQYGVVLKNRAGDILETEYLVWAEDSNRVWTNRPVMIQSEQGILYGDGLNSDARFETYEIINPKGEIILNGMDNL